MMTTCRNTMTVALCPPPHLSISCSSTMSNPMHAKGLIRWCMICAVSVMLAVLVIEAQKRYDGQLRTENSVSMDSFLATGTIADHDKRKLRQDDEKQELRVLYIITSLAEYNTGKRATAKGSDRLQETLIPVMREGVLDMIAPPYQYKVDVFIICHWDMKPERLQLIRDALPPQVGLDYWDSATPLGYKLEDEKDLHIQPITRALARQHRFVIRQHFLSYDMFASFEDDMLVKGPHIEHNIMISKEIDRLKRTAPLLPTDFDVNNTGRGTVEKQFHGDLTKTQLDRMMPGFIRVEVLLDEESYPAQNGTGPIPVDLDFGTDPATTASSVNPEYCCIVRNETSSPNMPRNPLSSKLMLWETNILALGVRKMPQHSSLDWVFLQRGPNHIKTELDKMIGEYWSGSHKRFGRERRPNPTQGKYINNMGGWMATSDQIWNWHSNVCPGSFLPPFDAPHFNYDGLDLRNVEYWSGGMHLFTRQHACNLQRIVTIDPDGFSKHLLYHTANNKQRQLTGRRESCFSKADTLLGQLNTVRKRAEKEMPKGKA